ncbi:hypothetical protein E2C01_075949 [Portunus trituberculatus]|uniref:Uncharacterized protein n=1 Tax=Portunus trituberculatus TaxID=210409 RepID=A0A5B7IHN7_PORTR|nr:hypothetical protein [Portunus trituberculatus]
METGMLKTHVFKKQKSKHTSRASTCSTATTTLRAATTATQNLTDSLIFPATAVKDTCLAQTHTDMERKQRASQEDPLLWTLGADYYRL